MKNQEGKIQSGILIGIVLTAAIAAGLAAFFLFDEAGTRRTLGPEYSYDNELEKYIKIDPALILYQQAEKTIQTDFEKTTAIEVGVDGKIYIAGDEKIVIYAFPVSVPLEIELGAEPTCIEVRADGAIWVGLTDHIGMMDSNGVVQAKWQPPASDAMLTSIAVDKDYVFVADAVNKVVWKYNHKGELLDKIGEKNSDRNIPGIVVPSAYFDITTYPDGLLRVVNPGRHWIEAYTANGDREWYWGTSGVDIKGFSGCCNPVALAVLPDGGFVTAEKGLVRVKIYDADGEFVGVVAGPDQLGWIEPLRVCKTPEECKAKGFDVAVDEQGRIYVLDTLQNLVRIFEKK